MNFQKTIFGKSDPFVSKYYIELANYTYYQSLYLRKCDRLRASL